MNAAIVDITGGVVLAVADDPGMHSSQNEQDSRYYADFGRAPCFEPADQQEAYEMTRAAFELSERFHRPVMLRLVTRLAHSRAVVNLGEPDEEKPLQKSSHAQGWILLPNHARQQWRDLLDQESELEAVIEESPFNTLSLQKNDGGLGVITTGLARNYYRENVGDMPARPSHLHIGAYPFPKQKIRELAEHCDRILVLEEGYPYVERMLRGILTPSMQGKELEILGKMSGEVPDAGELNPDNVRVALGLPSNEVLQPVEAQLAGRPPQLCSGCPHGNMYNALNKALEGVDKSLVASDIGCYTLGALPPYNAIESCVCMGASIGMAKGAAEAGLHPVVAVIGDSTFTHSGITPLLDAVHADTNMTVLILDNEAVAMTGGQESLLPVSRLEGLIRGAGVDPEHFHLIEAKPQAEAEHVELLKREMEHQGLSVILAVRECIETVKRKKQQAAAAAR
jgi:indolepyruvate ferredoxin oxidoreductase alpha subunit